METELACASEKEAQEMNKQRCEVQTPECVAGGGIESPWLALLQPARLPADCLSKFVSSDCVLSRSPRQK